MKRLALIATAASAAALAGCAAPTKKECETVPDTQVRVADDQYVVVNRDPIVVCTKDKWIGWQLAFNQPYRFTADGVEVDDRGDNEFSNCKPGKAGDRDRTALSFKCHNKNDKHGQGLKPRYYKYTIKLEIPGKAGSGVSVDPSIMNH